MAIIEVTNTLDDGSVGSLNGAIASASNGDTIVVAPGLAGETIDLSSSLDITEAITIEGNGIVVDGGYTLNPGASVTDMTVDTSGSVLIQGMTLEDGGGFGAPGASAGAAGGNTAGGLYIAAGSVTLASVAFKSNVGIAGQGAGGTIGSSSAAPNGGTGGNGGNAAGAIFNLGTLTINTSDTFVTDFGYGGHGGSGGGGYSKMGAGSQRAGYGGGGGAGGTGVGGIFNDGLLTINGAVNLADEQGQAGPGGEGGSGGSVDFTQNNTLYNASGGSYGTGGVSGIPGGDGITGALGAGQNGVAGYSSSLTGTGGAGGAGGGVAQPGAHGKQGSGTNSSGGGGGGGGVGLFYNGIYNVSCFCPGTMIETSDGGRAVEMLRIGDSVMTGSGAASPVKWIGRRAYAAPMVAANAQLRPVRIRANSLADGIPRRDLLVSPQHAMLVDGVLVPAAALVNGRTILREAVTGTLSYLHIELAGGELLLAEGALTESFLDHDSRALFQNAAQYAVLYPDETAAPPAAPAPRLTEGFRVAAIQRRLARRAGLAEPAPSGPLRGHVERIEAGSTGGWFIEGWAQDAARPDQPIAFDIVVDGAPVGRLVANRYRSDLDRAGLGGGIGGFRHALAAPGRHLALLRVGDGAALPGLEASQLAAA